MVGRTTYNALAASAQAAVTTAVGLVYFGYLMRMLGPEALGGWLAWLSLAMIACLADLALREALVRGTAVALAQDDERLAGDLLETTVLTVAATMGLAMLVLMAVLPRFVDFGAAARQADAWMIGGVAFMVWLQRVADVYAAALEGRQRYTTVARNNVVAALLGLATVLVLVPRIGVHAASLGLIVQYASSGLGNLLAVRRLDPSRSLIPRHWRWALCRKGLGYGLSVQTAVGSFIIIESVIKLALSRGNALALLSFFDLAFRIGRGLRNLLAAGNRVMVPRLAHAHATSDGNPDGGARGTSSDELESIYLRSFQAMLFLSIPTFALSAASAGFISLLTRGTVDPALVDMFLLTLPMWFVFSLADPAINIQMATGRLRPMLVAHASMLVLLLIGLLGIKLFMDAQGPDATTPGYVIIAVAIAAIMLPCFWMIWWHHHTRALPLSSLSPKGGLVAIAIGMFAAWMTTRFPGTLIGQATGIVVATILVLIGLRILPAWTWVIDIARRLVFRPTPIG